jgi:hypothetical protein
MATLARRTSTARSTVTLVSRQQLWPRNRTYPGLANGWQGTAWVAFKLAGGDVPLPERIFEAIARRVAREVEQAPGTQHVGALIGCAADAVIAAYAARRGSASKALAQVACEKVVSAVSTQRPAWDVHMGIAGSLLAFAEIAVIEPGALRDVQPGRMVGQLRASVDTLCESPALGWPTGMAHGLAGAIMALESCGASGWCRITSKRRQRWLDALTRCALAAANGALLWPSMAGAPRLGLQSWCAGTPGVALALLACFRLTREPAYLELARGALEGMRLLSGRAFFSNTLCCGNAGYRHIFLEASLITGDRAWVAEASRAARFSPAARPRPRLGLHQGELGIAYLAERLAKPQAYPLPALGASSG